MPTAAARPRIIPLAWVVLLLVAGVFVRPAAAQAGDPFTMSSALVVEGVGSGGRTLIQTDGVEALRVAGTWRAPAVGDAISLPGGEARKWEQCDAGQDGWIRVRPGGYACWTFDSDAEKVMILEASGHGSAIVNGEPRVGDPYELGHVRLPVLVKKGANEVLLKSGRGRVRAKLVEAPAGAFFNTADVTMPDLLLGEGRKFGGIIVVNAATTELRGAEVFMELEGGGASNTKLPTIPALSMRKVRVDLPLTPASDAGEVECRAVLIDPRRPAGERGVEATFKIGVRKATDKHKRTFISDIDGSVQYYAVVPPPEGTDLSGAKAVVLSLHGASVEAIGQANCYKQRDWCYVVCPTNRRPFGFDWEDWGRTDALEVLAEARRQFRLDSRRTYLTGHSMGGHGTWNIGVQFPGTFAAIGPSAGWISFWSYAGGASRENVSEIEKMLLRAACTSDTLAMKQNFAQQGVYILHGDADDNVPVAQARTMRKELGEFHPNFAYYEQAGAGHWWGDQCVDWDPMIEFFRRHVRPETKDIAKVEFTTVNPGVSAECHWIVVDAQIKRHEPSRIEATYDAEKKRVSVKTHNVGAFTLLTPGLQNGVLSGVEIDGNEVACTADALTPPRFRLVDGAWKEAWGRADFVATTPALFKTAFDNRAILVYGTAGSAEADAALVAKARFDAETFWYRGNGDFRVMSDTEYLSAVGSVPFDNVILYGNADTNAAWATVLGDTPQVSVRNGSIRIGDRTLQGDSLACLFLAPMHGDGSAMVGVVGGTGLAGMRLADRLPYFVSGVGIPDWVVISPELLTKGVPGLLGAGFFGPGGTAEGSESVWAAE